MKTSGYVIVVTAHYSDESSLDLETYECEDIDEVTSKLAVYKLKYKQVLSKEVFKDDYIKINIRALEIITSIPKLVSSFELINSSGWSGWSFI